MGLGSSQESEKLLVIDSNSYNSMNSQTITLPTLQIIKPINSINTTPTQLQNPETTQQQNSIG